MIRKIFLTIVLCFFVVLTVGADDDTEKTIAHPGASIKKYLVYMPDKYRRRSTKRWPVLFFLHGKGERGDDLSKARIAGVPEILGHDLPFILIVPQCKLSAPTWEVASLDSLYEDVKRSYPIDTNRVYLTGLSMGGYGTWIWASAHPERFAAIVPIAGYGLSRLNPCGMKALPIRTFHNTDDPTIQVSETRKIVQAVKACGNTQIYYTETPTGGHDSWTRAYKDPALFTWLSKQKN
ncbi:phospholipase [Chitinophaga sp. SYP-B3965]|uniref:carboxylesterase family protein n=1 Tax=Chitinophaga sp. SYP-B3965 TaxID=2663120 RepID=UPI001299AF94|nr:alpha/beta hydrolase-fold protein [Chitinophaga sp. SYP-B3965]MRG48088.1 phospholipase [Chitinophaga sp. SYP-B3965]